MSLEAIYHDMPAKNFSSDLLQRVPERLGQARTDYRNAAADRSATVVPVELSRSAIRPLPICCSEWWVVHEYVIRIIEGKQAMKSVSIRSTTHKKNAPAPQQQQRIANKPAAQKFQVLPLSTCEREVLQRGLDNLIATRAYELYSERGYRDGSALEDWLEAEREILSQVQPS